jgi:hypothetical protein
VERAELGVQHIASGASASGACDAVLRRDSGDRTDGDCRCRRVENGTLACVQHTAPVVPDAAGTDDILRAVIGDCMPLVLTPLSTDQLIVPVCAKLWCASAAAQTGRHSVEVLICGITDRR